MSIEDILEKLKAHNSGVIGCMASHRGVTYHNMRDQYELTNAEVICEEAAQIIDLMDNLGEEHGTFDEVFLEMQGHSVFAHRLSDGVLVVVNKPVSRSVFRRLKVGVNMFVKPLERVMSEIDASALQQAAPATPAPPAAAPAEAPKPPAEDETQRLRRKKRVYRGVEY